MDKDQGADGADAPYLRETMLTPDGDGPGETVTPADVDTDPLVSKRLGNYEVKSLLGKGGFGKVFRARDTELYRDVAIKMLHGTGGAQAEEFFNREGKALAALSKHPAIVQIHQWGEYEGQPYFVLEYVEGNATQLLQDCPEGVPVARALGIAAECAEALHAAHRQGILHRDIKPANILIEAETGRAKVADFGLARLCEPGNLTIDGTASGSPPYMSPEQVKCERLDARTDIYSLGVTLYELLCGKRPFDCSSTSDVLVCVREGRLVPLSQRRPDLPPAILELVEKAIAYHPADRYATADTFAKALRRVLHRLEHTGQAGATVPTATTLARPRTWVRPLVAGAVLAVVALALTTLLPGTPDAPEGPAQQANLFLKAGDFLRAQEAYAAIPEPEQTDQTRYACGLAAVQAKNLAAAEDVLARMQATERVRELQAALSLARGGEKAGNEAAQLLAEGTATSYGDVLLARVDALEARYDEVVNRLDQLGERSFAYPWQYMEAQRVLGQACFQKGDYKAAQNAFSQLGASNAAADQRLAAAYADLIEQRSRAEAQEQALAMADDIREMLDRGEASTAETDGWTSRPLSLYFLPVRAPRTPDLLESGLVDLLPHFVRAGVSRDSAITVVGRENLNEILREQGLAARLSSGTGKLALGHVVGARLLVTLEVLASGAGYYQSILLEDVETTGSQTLGPSPLDPALPPNEVAERLVSDLVARLGEEYPLQGRLYRDQDKLVLNIGAMAGVTEGMAFEVLEYPDDPVLSSVTATVVSAGPETARVGLEGVGADQVPTDLDAAWYVRVRGES